MVPVLMHALPRLHAGMLAARRAAERIDAHGGTWRFYVATLVAVAGFVVQIAALESIDVERMRTLAFGSDDAFFVDVVGATSTVVVVAAAVTALWFLAKMPKRGAIVVCVGLIDAVAMMLTPLVLIVVVVVRFGIDA